MHSSDPHRFPVPSRPDTTVWVQVALLVILACWALRAMAPVAIPVVFALLAVLVFAPLDLRLKNALPAWLSWLAHVIVMALMLGILSVFMGALAFAGQQLLNTMPDVSDQLDRVIASQSGSGGTESVPAGSQLRDLLGNASGMFGDWVVDRATALATTLANATASITGAFVSSVAIVFFIVLLTLTELDVWSAKLRASLGNSGAVAWHDAVASVTQRLRRFLVVRAGIGALQAALYVGWLAIFGLDLLLVWGVMTLVLNFIPNLGSIISAILPVLYALLVADLTTALMIAAGILLIEQVIGNYVDPRILGRQILLSPVVILVALLFWSWLWGIAGAFLATPIMLSLLVFFNHTAPLRPAALILSNQTSASALDKALAA